LRRGKFVEDLADEVIALAQAAVKTPNSRTSKTSRQFCREQQSDVVSVS
jgi:hypothetical protein